MSAWKDYKLMDVAMATDRQRLGGQLNRIRNYGMRVVAFPPAIGEKVWV